MIPGKLQIVLFFLYVWTFVLFYMSKVANIILGALIRYLPNILMPSVSHSAPIKIIKATDGNGVEITKRLEMFMKFKWDESMCDNGGIDLDIFFKYIGSTVIWVAYMFDYEITQNTATQFLTLIDDIEEYIKTGQHESDVKSDITDVNKDLNQNSSDSADSPDSPRTPETPEILDQFKKCIRFLVVDSNKKMSYKLGKDSIAIEAEDILFGEVNFFDTLE